jgi:hypothetical protein
MNLAGFFSEISAKSSAALISNITIVCMLHAATWQKKSKRRYKRTRIGCLLAKPLQRKVQKIL